MGCLVHNYRILISFDDEPPLKDMIPLNLHGLP